MRFYPEENYCHEAEVLVQNILENVEIKRRKTAIHRGI